MKMDSRDRYGAHIIRIMNARARRRYAISRFLLPERAAFQPMQPLLIISRGGDVRPCAVTLMTSRESLPRGHEPVTRERNGNRWAVKIQINNARRSSSPKRDLLEETIVLPVNATPASRAKLTSPFSRGISAQPAGGRHVIIKSACFPPADIALATFSSGELRKAEDPSFRRSVRP